MNIPLGVIEIVNEDALDRKIGRFAAVAQVTGFPRAGAVVMGPGELGVLFTEPALTETQTTVGEFGRHQMVRMVSVAWAGDDHA